MFVKPHTMNTSESKESPVIKMARLKQELMAIDGLERTPEVQKRRNTIQIAIWNLESSVARFVGMSEDGMACYSNVRL